LRALFLAFRGRMMEPSSAGAARPARKRGKAMTFIPWRTGAAAIALAALSGCTNVASLDCAEIATEAKRISQNEAIKIQTIADVRETARTENDARCEGNATMSDGSTGTLYLRAYKEGGNTMVAYQGTPYQ
jgi:hypothetical protein